MIEGWVTPEGIPQIELTVAGQKWVAVIDTGFNGDLELPENLKGRLRSRFAGKVTSELAGGYQVEEDAYLVPFHFDGIDLLVEAVFGPVDEILIGTRLLDRHRLEISFPDRTLVLAVQEA